MDIDIEWLKFHTRMSSNTDYIKKLMLVGDSEVGKSSLLSRFVRRRTIQLDGRSLYIMVWDTAGMERFRSITRVFYRGAEGVIFVYDVTKKESFENLGKWLEKLDMIDKDPIKCDLTSQRQVDYVTAKEYADKQGIPLVETSAKNGANVDEAFVRIAFDIKKRMFDTQMDNKSSIKLKSKSRQKAGGCC